MAGSSQERGAPVFVLFCNEWEERRPGRISECKTPVFPGSAEERVGGADAGGETLHQLCCGLDQLSSPGSRASRRGSCPRVSADVAHPEGWKVGGTREGGGETPGRAGAFPAPADHPPRSAGGGRVAETKPSLPSSSPPPLPSFFPSSSSSSRAGKPSPAPVCRATSRPRLRDLRGGPARGKGRWQRRPHPLCPHPAPWKTPGCGFCGVQGAGCCSSHSPPPGET